MYQLSNSQIEAISGGYQTAGGTAGDVILTASGALLGFCFGGIAGAMVGAEFGHAYAQIIID